MTDFSPLSNFAANASAYQSEAQLNASKESLKAASHKNETNIEKTAKDFEAVFVSQLLGPVFDSLPSDGLFGGGQAENVFRGLFVNELGKSIVQAGGIGIADRVKQELLKLQEA